MKSEKVFIYIESSKPFYYSGEQISASVYLDVLSNIQTSKIIIIAKGKEIIKASQKTYIKTNYDDEDNDDYSDDQDTISQNRDKKRKYSRSSRYYEDEDESKNSTTVTREINEENSIFKFKKIILISNDNILSKGKYIFPFEITLPNNLPGSFLFMSKNSYVEIIYTIKIKLSGIKNYQKSIPIIIRQKEKNFNYYREAEFNKQIGECCCDFGQVAMKLHLQDKYVICGSKVRTEVIVNNKRCGMTGAPVTMELFQKIILHPNDKKSKIKITKLAGRYKGNINISPRSIFNDDISLVMDENQNINDNIDKTKANKYFKNKKILTSLNQSMKCNYLSCEYEMYVEVQFSGWSSGELGCFINVLVYPPEKGIFLKETAEAVREFSNSLVCKKAYINDKDCDDDREFMKKNGTSFAEKVFDPNEQKREEEYYMDDSESKEDYNDVRNKRKNKVNENYNKNNDMKISTKRNDKKDIDSYVGTNSEDNTNVNTKKNLNNNNTSIKKNEKGLDSIMNEEGSFGNSTKDKQQRNYKNYYDTNSNNIKKDFDKNYLDDELDEEFLK